MDETAGAQKWKADIGSDTVPITSVGVNLFYNHMKLRNSGYVSMVQVEMGYTNAWCSDLDQFYDSNMQGFNTKALWGWGYAPIRRKDFILTVHGMLGLEFFYLTDTVPDSITHGENKSNVFVTPLPQCLIGANVQAIYRIRDHFSVAAGLTIYTGLGLFSGVDLIVPDETTCYAVSTSIIACDGITVEPRISACWVYD